MEQSISFELSGAISRKSTSQVLENNGFTKMDSPKLNKAKQSLSVVVRITQKQDRQIGRVLGARNKRHHLQNGKP